MTKEKKEYIDNLWMNTDYGKWVLFSSEDKVKEANEIMMKINNQYPWNAEIIGKELSVKIANELNSEEEFDDYIKALDKENYNLVAFMISNDVFGTVYDLLNHKN